MVAAWTVGVAWRIREVVGCPIRHGRGPSGAPEAESLDVYIIFGRVSEVKNPKM